MQIIDSDDPGQVEVPTLSSVVHRPFLPTRGQLEVFLGLSPLPQDHSEQLNLGQFSTFLKGKAIADVL